MTVTCACQNCKGGIDFDVEQANQFIECPLCHNQTRLLLPSKPKFFEKSQAKPENRMTYCLDCGNEVSFRAPLCPHCGGFRSIPFGLVFQVFCWVMVSAAVFSLIGLLFLLPVPRTNDPRPDFAQRTQATREIKGQFAVEP